MYQANIFIIGDERELMAQLQQVLRNENWDCPAEHLLTPEHAEYQLATEASDLTFLVFNGNAEKMIQLLARIPADNRGRLVAVGTGNDADLMVQAMRHGVQDFVDALNLEQQIQDALERYLKSQRNGDMAGKVIACLPACGGAGTTTIAVNLACHLAKIHQSTALFEVRKRGGDAASLLDLQPEYNIADLCRHLAKLDETFFRSLLCSHSSGVDLLSGPIHYRDGDLVTPDGAAEAVRMGKLQYPRSVVDLDHPYSLATEQILTKVDLLLLVVRPEFAALHNARELMEYLQEIGVAKENLKVVVNRYTGKYDIPQKQVEEVLRVEHLLVLPEDAKHVTLAGIRGIPAIIGQRGSIFSRQLKTLATEVEQCCTQPVELVTT